MIPFLVADRPASLRIIKGSNPHQYDIKVGIMAHANTSERFQKLLKNYPCSDEPICDVVRTRCAYKQKLDKCEAGRAIRENTLLMGDSDIFAKAGSRLNYVDLFECYEYMTVSYGVMIDVFRDSNATIQSAEDALRQYGRKKYHFKLVAVAQGNSVEEYLKCYERLFSLGFEHIAVGGLLKKRKSSRFVAVEDNELLFDVLDAIKNQFSPKWLFALGCFSPSRVEAFVQRNLWGSDYKGWIFNYLKRDEALRRLLSGRETYRGIPILDGFSPQILEDLSEQEWRFNMVRRFLQSNVYERVATAQSNQPA